MAFYANYNRMNTRRYFNVWWKQSDLCGVTYNREIVFDPAPAPEIFFVPIILINVYILNNIYSQRKLKWSIHIHRGIMLFDANFFLMKAKKKKKRDIFLLKKKGSKNSIARVPSNIYMFYILLYVNILGRIVRRRIDAVRDGNPQHECTRWYQCYITVFISC